MLHFPQAIINTTTMSATQFNTLSGASKKMHMYAVHVLIHLHSKGFLPEDFKPIDLDTTLVDSFDQDAIKAEFKKLTKKTKATKIVSSPREDVVSAIATTFYENKNTDISTNPITNPIPEKPKRKYNRKPKNADADATVPADTNDTVPAVVNDIVADIVQAAQSDVVKEKKKRAPKKAVTPPATDAPAADVTADAPPPDAPQVKEKKPRTKKVPTPPPTSDVQEQPVEIQSVETQPAPEVKEKKSRAKKVPTPSTSDVQEQPVSEVKETKEKKEKKSRAKKVEVPSTPPLPPTQELVSEPSIIDNNDQDQDQDQEDSEEIQARILIYQDKEYLVDAEGTVYDKVSFDEIGIFQNDIINFN